MRMWSGSGRAYCPLKDRSLVAWSLAWWAAVLVAFGLVAAIIPSPVFGRGIAPEPFAVAVWLASAPLIGLVTATYFAPLPPREAVPLRIDGTGAGAAETAPGSVADRTAETAPHATADAPVPDQSGSTLGTVGGVAAFLAIGCPTCNKVALVLLGAGGATTVFGSLQPFIGAASLVLLALTAAWRLRIRARGGACAVPRNRVARA
jgi:hypothetical protein